MVFPGFVEAAIPHAHQNLVDILVLPAGLSSNALEISTTERQELLRQVELQTQQIAAICSQKISEGMRCRVSYAPVFVRSDTQTLALQDYFRPSLSAVIILEQEPYLTSRIINGTPLERQITNAYYAGVLVAGATYLSRSQITGYAPGITLESAFDFGAVEVENSSEIPANPYQMREAHLATSFFQADSVGQMLNALTIPGFPEVAIGVEESSGVQLESNRTLQDPTGDALIPIFDASTYHTAAGARFTGPQYSLSLRNILFHTLVSGEFFYDLIMRQHSTSPPADHLSREYTGMEIPAQAGALVLSGKLDDGLPGNAVLVYFLNLAGGKNAFLKVILCGYPSLESAQQEAEVLRSQLGVNLDVQFVLNTGQTEIDFPPETTGIVILARYPSLLGGIELGPIEEAWRSGLPLLAIDAGASLAGGYYVAQELPGDLDPGTSNRPANFGQVRLEPGMQLVEINIEPQVNEENRWDRLLHLAYNHPSQPAVGLSENSAVVFMRNGAFTIGERPVAVLDLGTATLGLGEAAQLVVANGLLDIFAPGDILVPQVADRNASPIPFSLPPGSPNVTHVPSQNPLSTPAVQPEVVPTPTEGDFIIPIEDLPIQPEVLFRPPPGQILTFLLVALPVLVVLIIMLGLWINRRSL